MSTVGIRELKRDASKILRKVREEGVSFDVTYHGKVVARLTPVSGPDVTSTEELATLEELFEEWEELAEEIGKHWPEGLSSVDAVRESRDRFE